MSADLVTFLNPDEFADEHDIEIGGASYHVAAVVDSDILKKRSDRRSDRYDGVYASELAVYARASDLPRPVFGQHLRLDGKLYVVAECIEDAGMLEIVLGANES